MRELIGKKTVCYFAFVKRRRADLGFLKKLRRGFVVVDIDFRDLGDIGEGWEGERDQDEDTREDEATENIESNCAEAVKEVQTKRRKQRIFMYVLV